MTNVSDDVLAILNLQLPTEFPETMPKELLSILRSIKLPILRMNSFIQIPNSPDLSEMFKFLNFAFPIIPTILLLIEKQDQFDQQSADALSVILLYTYISWLMYINETGDFQYTDLILNCIPVLSNSKNFNLLRTVFFKMITRCLKETEKVTLNTIFQAVVDYYAILEMKDIEYENMLISILNFVTSQNHDDAHVFMLFIIEMISDGYKFSEQSSLRVFKSIIPFAVQLDSAGLNLMLILRKSIPEKNFVKTYKDVIKSTTNLRHQIDSIEEALSNPSMLFYTKELEPKISFEFSKNETFEETITQENLQETEINMQNTIVLPEIVESLRIISTITRQDDSYCEILLKQYSLAYQKDFSILITLINIITYIPLNSANVMIYLNLLLNSKIFNDSYDPKSNPQYYQLFFSTVKSLYISNFKGISYIYSMKCLSFFITPVLIEAMLNYFSSIEKSELSSNNFINSFVKSSCYFQEQHKYANNENFELIQSARKSILLFITKVANDEELSQIWFSDSNFLRHLFSLLCEQPVKQFAENILITYASKSAANITEIFPLELIYAFEQISLYFPQEEFVNLGISVITIANTVLSTDITKSSIFYQLCPILIAAMSRLSKEEYCFQFFTICMKFLNFNSTRYILSFSEISILAVLTHSFSAEQYKMLTEDFYRELLYDSTYNTKYFYQNAQILSLLFECCSSSDEYIQLLKQIQENIQNSLYNIKICFNSQFDIYLLEKLLKFKYQENPDAELISLMLQLLDLILTYFCHEKAASLVADLLLPLTPNTISKYHEKFVNFFLGLLSNSKGKENAYATLSNETQIIEMNNAIHFKSGEFYKIGVNIFIENHVDVSFRLFSFTDGKNTININLKGDKLNALAISDTRDEYNFKNSIKRGEWTKFYISIFINKKKLNLTAFIGDAQETATFDHFEYNIDSHSTYAFLPYDFAYKFPIGYISKITFETAEVYKPVEIIPPQIEVAKFIDTFFGTEEKLKQILMILSYEKYFNSSKNLAEKTISWVVNILSRIFTLNPISQCTFTSKGCPQLLSEILVRLENITYKTYLTLYELTKSIETTLVIPYLKYVILNMDIWCKCRYKDILSIIMHWNTVILVQYQNSMSQALTVYDFVHFVKDNYDESDEDIRAIITTYIHVLTRVISTNIDQNQIQYLIGECQITKTFEVIKTFVAFTKAITVLVQNPLISKYYQLLHTQVSSCDEQMFIDIMDIILHLRKRNMLTTSFSRQVLAILRLIPQTICTPTVLKYLVNAVSSGIIELIPLCCYVCCECSDATSFLKAIENKSGLNDSDDIIIWLLILFDHFEDYRKQIFETIFDVSKISVVCSIIFILRSPFLCEHLATDFLSLAIDKIIEHSSSMQQQTVAILLHFSFASILFQPRISKDIFIETLIFNSQYKYKMPRRSSSMMLPIYKILDKSITSSLADKFVFSLSVNEHGKWNDEEFALKVIKLYSLFPTMDHAAFDICICSFLAKNHPNEVVEHLKTLPQQFLTTRATYGIILRLYEQNIDFDLSFCESEYSREAAFRSLESIATDFPLKEIVNVIISRIKDNHTDAENEEKSVIVSCYKDLIDITQKLDSSYSKEKNEVKMHCLTELKQIYDAQNSKIGKLSPIKYYTRDESLCNGVPMKLKINEDYNDHKVASVKRDDSNAPKEEMKNPKYSEPKSPNLTLVTAFGEFPASVIRTKKYWIVKSAVLTQKIPVSDILSFVEKTYLHKHRAFEVYLRNGKTLFFVQDKTTFISDFPALPPIQSITNQWLNYEITTYEYLLELNRRSSRSFNVLNQYPLMPWVILDFNSESLNLSSPSTFRDFSLPAGMISHDKLQKNIAKSGPFVFNAAPMNEMTVLHYFIREEPFTTLHIHLQSGKFDHSRRLFCSIPDIIDSRDFASELTPEFFCHPDFLINKNKFDFGLENPDVILPKWASSPIQFVYINRKALESDYVSENINKWIDMIWGVEQNKGYNTYNPVLYQDNPDENMMKGLGVMPAMLFNTNHPKREISHKTSLRSSIEVLAIPLKDIKLCLKNGIVEIFGIKDNQIKIGLIKENFVESTTIQASTTMLSVYSSEKYAYTASNSQAISTIRFGTVLDSINFSNIILLMDMDHQYTVCVTEDSVIHVIENRPSPKLSIIPLDNDISCIKVKSEFDMLVFGTKKGMIGLISISEQCITKYIRINHSIDSISITPSWGFIVAASKKEITITDINLNVIASKKFDQNIINWCAWKDIHGFDQIAVHFDDGLILMSEVFYLEFECIGKFNHNNTQMIFMNHSSKLFVLSEDGHGVYLSI